MAIDLGKAKKLLSQSFLENHQEINEDDAAHMIVKAEQEIQGLLSEKAADENLNAAKQVVKDLNEGYSSAVNYEKAKIQFLLSKIEEIQEGVNEHASV